MASPSAPDTAPPALETRPIADPRGAGYVVRAGGAILKLLPDGAHRQLASYWARTKKRGQAQAYLRVDIPQPGGGRWRPRVHVLVAEAFHGARPSPAHHARHLNDDRADCRAANVAWGTCTENARDAVANDRHPFAKLTVELVVKLREAHALCGNVGQALRETGAPVTASVARKAILGKTWAHVAMLPKASTANDVGPEAA